MKKQLAIVSTVQPKPTKAEIVDALTQLEVQRRDDKSKADVEKRKEMVKEINAELLAHFNKSSDKSSDKSNGDVRWDVYHSGEAWARVGFDITSIPKALKAKMVVADKLPTLARQHRFCDVRKDILNASSGFDKTTRVSRLLKNDESRKSLEKILDTFKK